MRIYPATVLAVWTSALAAPPDRLPAFRSSSCRCGIRNGFTDGTDRIVGGREAEANEFPWQAALMRRGGGWAGCGATVISRRHVITAAHCTVSKTAEDLSVMLHSHHVFSPDADSLRFEVEQVIDYPGYEGVHEGNDFSLLRLKEPIDFPADNSIAPACLPPAGDNFVGANATVSGFGAIGWGGSIASSLRAVDVTVISQDVCKAAYPGQIPPSALCADGAGERDACQGDSGGPLVSKRGGRFMLIGVVSWGKECAKAEYPGVYARVTEALEWIRQKTAEDDFCG